MFLLLREYDNAGVFLSFGTIQTALVIAVINVSTTPLTERVQGCIEIVLHL